jgi:hypothetical protein
MESKYERGILRITLVFLIAAAILIPLGYLGVGPSIPLVVGQLGLAGVLYYAWKQTEEYDQYLAGLWLGPIVGVIATGVALLIGASPGELMSIGGLVGIVGVVNMLLRPVYRLLSYLVSFLLSAGGGGDGESEGESESA